MTKFLGNILRLTFSPPAPLKQFPTSYLINCNHQELSKTRGRILQVPDHSHKKTWETFIQRIGLSLPFHCMKLLTWLTATIMNWRWVGKLRWGKVLPGEPTELKKIWSEGADDLQKQQILRRALTSRICGYFLTLFCRETKRKDKAKQQIVGETDRAWFCGFGLKQKVIEAIPTMDTKACSWFIECKMVRKQVDTTD